jgi:hypothetical protein
MAAFGMTESFQMEHGVFNIYCMKKCSKCDFEKEVNLFPTIGNICKECKNEYSKNQKRKLKEINPEKYSESKKKYYLNNKDKFKEWDVKSRNNPLNKEKRKKYRQNNKEILLYQQKEYYQNNKKNISEKQKQYYLDNKGKIKERNLNYVKNNKDKLNESRRNWHKNKLETDKLYLVKCKIRSSINSAFERIFNGTYKKSKKSNDILGCSYDDFKIYIENKFDENMNWDNHGEYWEMDHIIPISWAKTEEEIYKLNHYTNFQPLIKQINKSKSNYYSG